MTKIDEEYEDSKFEIVDVFEHRGRVCVIIKVKWMERYDGYLSYNGYVSLKKPRFLKRIPYEKDYSDFEGIAQDGLTYDGYLGREWRKQSKSLWVNDIPEDLYFFGFDTLHSWNNEENSSYEAVRRKTLNMADNMIAQRI